MIDLPTDRPNLARVNARCNAIAATMRNLHERQHDSILRCPVGLCAADEAAGASASEIPRSTVRAQSGGADQGTRRGGGALVRSTQRRREVGRRISQKARYHA